MNRVIIWGVSVLLSVVFLAGCESNAVSPASTAIDVAVDDQAEPGPANTNLTKVL